MVAVASNSVRRANLVAVAFACGLALYGIGATGMRFLAPFFGAGVLLGSALAVGALVSLAAGHLLAALLEDRAGPGTLARPLVAAGLWLLLVPLLRHPLLTLLHDVDLRLSLTAALLVFFVPPWMLVATALPLCVRVAAGTRERALQEMGRLYAAAALAAALWAILELALYPRLGAQRLLMIQGLLLLAAAGLALSANRDSKNTGAAVAVLALVSVLISIWIPARATARSGLLQVVRGRASELRVLDLDDARYLLRDGSILAVVSPGTWYPLHLGVIATDLVKHLFPAPGRMLVAGLRGASAVESFAHSGWKVDVVEADPVLESIARSHFGLAPQAANVHVGDARRFLDRHPDAYDFILLDDFGTAPVPYHQMTREFFALAASRLRPEGVLGLHVEGLGWEDPLVRVLAATLRQAFTTVIALPTAEPPDKLGSIVLLAANRPLEFPDDDLPDPKLYTMEPYPHWVVRQTNHAWFSRFEPDVQGVRALTDDRNAADLLVERVQNAGRRELHAFFGPYGQSW